MLNEYPKIGAIRRGILLASYEVPNFLAVHVLLPAFLSACG
jgi:hypothetical protein